MKTIRSVLALLCLGVFIHATRTFAQIITPAGMTSIPAGTFTMGDALDGESDAPATAVTVSAFFIDTNIVTTNLWTQVRQWGLTNGYTDTGSNASGLGANYPVDYVTWYDVVKWCNARSQKAGYQPVYYTDAGLTSIYKTGTPATVYVNWTTNGFRLPTEAEWEKAARGGLAGLRFPSGNTISESQANYVGATYNPTNNTGFSYDLGPSGANTHWYTNVASTGNANTVGYYAPNDFGVYDMTGNMFEWCWDWYGAYATGPLTDPHGAASGTVRLVRGGGWNHFANECRCAYRGTDAPTLLGSEISFRTVLAQNGYVAIILQASPTNEGSVSGGGTFAIGQSVTNFATPNLGYALINWTSNGTAVSAANPYILTALANETLVANFALSNYLVSVSPNPTAGGLVSGGGTFFYNNVATNTATPNVNYIFSNWTVNGLQVSASPTYIFTITNNESLLANFALVKYTNGVSVSPITEGSATGTGVYTATSLVTNIATPNPGYQFVNWTVGGTVISTVPDYVYAIEGNNNIAANFAPQMFTISPVAYPTAGGTTSGGGTVALNTSVTLTAFTNAGYQFVGWSVNNGLVSVANPYTFSATTNETVVAIFGLSAAGNTVTLLPSPMVGGTLAGGGAVPTGTVITNIATPNTGYGFVNWMTNGVVVNTNTNYSFTVSNDEILIGNFAQIDFTSTVIANPPAGGTVGGGGTFLSGYPVTNTATANSGYLFTNWTENGNVVSTLANYNYNITNNRILVANFNALSNTLSVVAYLSADGTVTGGGTVLQGTVVTNTATANSGYVFVNWTINGVQVGASSPYSMPVSANQTLVANFAPVSYTSTVIANPVGGGTVAGGGVYLTGATITNTATSQTGYAFVNWTENGVPVSTASNYVFALTNNRTLIGNFQQVNFTVTIAPYPVVGGSVSGGGTYSMGTVVTNIATANSGYQLVNWMENGVQVSTSTSYSYTLTTNRNLIANFSPINDTVTVIANPAGGGTVSGGGTVLAGSSVNAIATPNLGYQFVNWTVNGNAASTSSPYSFVVTSNETLVANFNEVSFTLTAVPYPSEAGTVTGGGFFPSGTLVTNSETTNGGFEFVNWTLNGVVVGTDSNYVVNVTSNDTLVANFEPSSGGNTIVLIAYPEVGGDVDGGGFVPDGTIMTNTATPDVGYQFVNWTLDDGTIVTTSNIYILTVTNDEVLVANFAPVDFTLTVDAYPGVGGTVGGGGTVLSGTTVTNIASANTGYQFTNWTTNGVTVSTSSNYPVVVSNDETLVANFTPIYFTSTVIPYQATFGSVSGGGTYLLGATVTNTATTNLGYQFINWTENGSMVSTTPSYVYTIATNRILVANFQPINYTLTVVAFPGNAGSVTGGGFVPAGGLVTNTAQTNSGYLFVNWTINGLIVGTTTNYVFTATNNETLVANFTPIDFTVSATAYPTAGGSVTGGNSYLMNSTVTNKATANTGYAFTGWTENGSVVTASPSYIYTIATNRNLVANFVPTNFTVTIAAYPGTEGSVTGGGIIQGGGTSLNTATANTGYQFVNWTSNGVVVSTTTSYSFTVSTNVALVANFAPLNFTLTVLGYPSTNGAVAGGGTVLSNSLVTNTATANSGYAFVNWTLNGAQVSTASPYVVSVTSNSALVANFAPVNFTDTVIANPASGGTASGGGTVVSNTIVSDVATANTGYQFTNWTVNGVQVSTSATYAYPLTSNETLVANFIPVNFTLTVLAYPATNGTVTGGGYVLSNTVVTNTASPNAGYSFVNWTVNGAQVSTSTNYSTAVTSNETLVANFQPLNYTVTLVANPTGGGSVSGGGTKPSGSSVTNIAAPATGYAFVNWTVNGVQASTSSTYSFPVSSNATLVANFAQVDFTVSVLAYPGTSGSVTGGGTVLSNTIITNVATPVSGYQFVNWTVNGAQASASANYPLTVTSNETLVANFIPVNFTSTVMANPVAGGSVSGGGLFLANTTVTNTATTNGGYQFVNWTENGNQASTAASYIYALSTNRILVANFTPVDFTITPLAYPAAGGTVSGGGTYLQGTTGNVLASTNGGYQFVSWTSNGTVVSTSSNYSFTVVANENLVANFTPVDFTVTAVAFPAADGSVTGGGTVQNGTTITNEAFTNGGYKFVNWTVNGNQVSTSSNYSFAVGSNETLVGNFQVSGVPVTVTLLANPVAGGTVGGGGTYPTNTLITNSAAPNAGYQFVNWTSNGVVFSTSNIFALLTSNDLTLEANFTPVDFTVAVVAYPTEEGSVLGGGTFLSGTLSTNVAIPSQGYQFINWTVNSNIVSTSNTYVFAVTNNEVLAANFAPVAYTINATTAPAGAGVMANLGGTFFSGSSGSVSVMPNIGYTFLNWSINGVTVSTSNTYGFTVGGNQTLVANFMTNPPSYIVTLNASPANGGTVSGGGTFPAGTLVTNAATPNNGFSFIGWTGDATGTADPLILAPHSDLDITANFADNSAGITLTVLTEGNGFVTQKPAGSTFTSGKSVTLTAEADPGFLFAGWTGSTTSDDNPLTVTMQTSMVLQANFIPNPFPSSTKSTFNGLFSVNTGVSEQTAGMLKGLSVSEKGTFSGSIVLAGASHSFSGAFNAAGETTNTITLKPSGSLTVAMNLSEDGQSITGTVSQSGGAAPWTANLTAYLSTASLASYQYTMLIPPDNNNAPPASSPGGDGYALIADTTGTAKIAGALADGTAFSETTPVSQSGFVPIYASLYKNQGLLLGWINLQVPGTNSVGLTWIHPPLTSGLFQGGFTNVLLTNQILLSGWTNPPPSELTNLIQLSMIGTFTNAGTNTPIAVTVSTAGKIAGASVSGTINAKSGLLTVTIGSGSSKVTGYGAVLLNTNYAGGYIVTKTTATAVQLAP